MTLDEVKKILGAIRNVPIKSSAKGTRAIGHTLESRLGIKENNIAEPDLEGGYELKAHDQDSSSRITAFTKAPCWMRKKSDIIKEYGKLSEDGKRYQLYNDVHSVFQVTHDDRYLIIHNGKDILFYWEWKDIINNLKIQNLCVIYAEKEKKNGAEYFKYNSGQTFSIPDKRKLIEMILNGQLVIEARCWEKKVHSKEKGAKNSKDHGWAFRWHAEVLQTPGLYKITETF